MKDIFDILKYGKKCRLEIRCELEEAYEYFISKIKIEETERYGEGKDSKEYREVTHGAYGQFKNIKIRSPDRTNPNYIEKKKKVFDETKIRDFDIKYEFGFQLRGRNQERIRNKLYKMIEPIYLILEKNKLEPTMLFSIRDSEAIETGKKWSWEATDKEMMITRKRKLLIDFDKDRERIKIQDLG